MVVLIAKNTVKEGLQQEFLKLAKEMTVKQDRKRAASAMIWQATKVMHRCSTLSKNIRMKRRWNFIGQPSISGP